MSDKDKRQGWLRDLRVGDEVAWFNYNFGHEIHKVERITPTGRIVVENITFDYTGEELGSSNNWYKPRYLTEITDEIRNEIKRNELVKTIKLVRWNEVDVLKLEKIINILHE